MSRYLQGHAVHYDFLGKEVPVVRDAVLKDRLGPSVPAMLVDQIPHHLPKNGSPGLTNVMLLVEVVQRGVGVGVRGHVGGVRDAAKPVRIVVDPGAERHIGVSRPLVLKRVGDGVEVAPALAHASSFDRVQTIRVVGAAGQACGYYNGYLARGLVFFDSRNLRP